MYSWPALHLIASGVLSILNVFFKIKPQVSCNIGAGDSNTKSVKLHVPLFIRKV